MSKAADSRAVIVSGGTSGLGLATAQLLAERGARVWILGSREQTVAAALSELDAVGGTACDAAADAAVEAAVAEAVGEMGGLDGVFVNAGIDGERINALELDVNNFRRVLEVNVIGAFVLARAAARLMERGSGIVINASDNGLRPEHARADYNVSKAAAITLAQSLALDFAALGIAVSAICPGYIRTPMTAAQLDDPQRADELLSLIPAGRFGELADVAELVDFLLSGRASYLTGSVISVDGGRSV